MSKQSELDEILDIHDNLVLLRKAKAVEEVLDRLESQRLLFAVGSMSGVPMSAIEAERNKLKESK